MVTGLSHFFAILILVSTLKQQQKAAGEVEKAKKMSIFFFMITLLVVCAKITLGSIIDLDSFFTVLLGGSDNY